MAFQTTFNQRNSSVMSTAAFTSFVSTAVKCALSITSIFVVAAAVRSVRCQRFCAVTTVIVAFALIFPALSQDAYGQASTRTREATQRVPGERITFQQRQALMRLGAGSSIEF